MCDTTCGHTWRRRPVVSNSVTTSVCVFVSVYSAADKGYYGYYYNNHHLGTYVLSGTDVDPDHFIWAARDLVTSLSLIVHYNNQVVAGGQWWPVVTSGPDLVIWATYDVARSLNLIVHYNNQVVAGGQ